MWKFVTVPTGTVSSKVLSRFVLEFDSGGLRSDEDIGSGSAVNRLVDELLCQRPPSVDCAHGDLTSREQRPELRFRLQTLHQCRGETQRGTTAFGARPATTSCAPW